MAKIKLNNNEYLIPDSMLADYMADFITHLGTIAGSGLKVVIGGVEYSIDSTKISSALSGLESAFSDLKGESPELTYGCTVEAGDYIYTYIGVTTLEEYRNSVKPQLETETGMSWNDIVSQYGNGDEEALWEMLGITGDNFFTVEPSWSVAAANTSISGSNLIEEELEGAPVTTVSSRAFQNCTKLKSIVIPNSVTVIGDAAFSGCSALESMVLPFVGNTVSATFANKTTLFGYIFGTSSYDGGSETVQNYSTSGKSTYYIPTNLKLITITGGSILWGAFYNCENLTSVTLNNNVTSISTAAFSQCTNLVNITIPNSITEIGNSAFSLCESLTSVTIPNSVTSIGEYAFLGCNGLTSIIIPDSVTSIGDHAFEGCKSFTSVYITNIAAWCNISFGSSFANPLYYAHNLYLNEELVTELVIPDSVTSIGDHAFDACESLTSVTIGDSVTSIGDFAFNGCTSLVSVTMPDSVTDIGSSAFSQCTNLVNIKIPDGVTTIVSNVFYYCSSLRDITIPDSVTSIGQSAFDGCTSLVSIVIPDSVISISSKAFNMCSNLTSVTIGDSVTSISSQAFRDCTSLVNINFNGTIEQWNASNINSSWNTNVPATYVQCSDGQVSLV